MPKLLVCSFQHKHLPVKPFQQSTFLQKNPTPNQIAFFSGLAIAGISTGVILLMKLSGLIQTDWIWLFVNLIITLLAAYGVAIFYLKKYIYRKIKLIYKTIHRRKLNTKEKTNLIDVNEDIIGEVEKEVEEWSTDQMEEIESLRSYEEYRRKFVGDISHELKTPIFNIQGYLDTLLEGAMDDKKVRKKFLNRASTNAERLTTIVEDLEAITRLESGKLILDFQEFSIKKLVEECFEDLEMKMGERGVSLVLKQGAGTPYNVKADKENIRQVLMNLLTNSIKYGKKNGETKVAFYEMGEQILVEVSDNGSGIEEKHLGRLFERFYRVDKSRSREQGGSGLGLSIVKHIIEAHAQTINVRSALGVGTTFGFTLEKA